MMSTLQIRSIIVSCRVAAGSSSSCRRRSPILAAQHRLKSNVSSDEIVVTQHRSSSLNGSTVIHNDDATVLVDDLLARTSEMMMLEKNGSVGNHHRHVVAYSGGVDSSLVAALVHRVFSQQSSSSGGGSVRAVLGISNAVPRSQIHSARAVASYIGIPLTEIPTKEGEDDAYKRNDGYACYVCKTHLYSTLEAVAMHVANTKNEEVKVRQNQRIRRQLYNDGYASSSLNADTMVDDESEESCYRNGDVTLYNGTNADDLHDPTRLGLVAASNFAVRSPLSHMAKLDVRRAAKHLGLPNWNAAASPCLRSRLAMGVEATSAHLKAVEDAECFVKKVLGLDDTVNVRVRMLSGGRAMVELDDSFFVGVHDNENWVVRTLHENGFEDQLRKKWGFTSLAGVRQFRTGSVAAVPTEGKGDGLPLVSSVY